MIENDYYTQERIDAIEEFEHMRGQAKTNSFLRWLLAKPQKLEEFESLFSAFLPNRRYLGAKEIPVAAITGSVNRTEDFDGGFRPLSEHLRDRWVNLYLRDEHEGWPPIRVFKVGLRYFVEDGHHRVSVARAKGMLSIRAEVWEYPLLAMPADSSSRSDSIKGLPLA